MGSIFGHRIDYNGVGVLRGPRHEPSKKLTQVPPGRFLGPLITGTSEKRVTGPGFPQPRPQGAFPSLSQGKATWGRGWGFPCLVGHMEHPPADQSRTLGAILWVTVQCTAFLITKVIFKMQL